MTAKNNNKNKRKNDLQWLRALAILAVIGFHIWPSYFPCGYLGVDIFFVLSGFLITKILATEESLKSMTLLTFYSKRIKRIFPIFLFVITIFFILGYFLLINSHFEYLKIEVLWSIFFVNNFYPMFHQKQYFEMVSEYNFFVHTWSLGVEIQFYLMAPFLIKFILLKNNWLKWTFIFGFLSLLLHFLIPNKSISFGLVFCRIWQFLIGTFAYFWTIDNNKSLEYIILLEEQKQEKPCEKLVETNSSLNSPTLSQATIADNNLDEELEQQQHQQIFSNHFQSSQNYKSIICIFCLGLICFLPPFSFSTITNKYLHILFRLLITILTGYFIISNLATPLKMPKFLDSLLVYIGNASYVIYLIHWPLIIYFRYFEIHYGNFFTLFCIFISSFIIHECFEKPFGKQSWIFNLVFIIFFYISILVFCFIKIDNDYFEKSQNALIKANENEVATCTKFYYSNCDDNDPWIQKYFIKGKEQPLHFQLNIEKEITRSCSFKLNSISNNSIMITGNSFAFFAIHGIFEAIKQSKMNFSKVYYLTRVVCVLLGGELNAKINHICNNYTEEHIDLLNIIKPTVIIHYSRMDHIPIMGNISMNMNDTENDSFYLEIKKTLSLLTNFTQKLIIIEPNPVFKKDLYSNPLDVAKAIFTHQPLTNFNISIAGHHKAHDPSWNRIKEAVKHCQKCEIISTENIFCSEDFCHPVNLKTKLAMYCDNNHMTPKTSLKLTSSILKALDGLK